MNSYDSKMLKKITKGKTKQQKALKYFISATGKDKFYDEKVIYDIQKESFDLKQLTIFAEEKHITEASRFLFRGYNWCCDRFYSKSNCKEVFNCLGKDGRFRSSEYYMTWLFLLPDQLIIFTQKTNTILNTKHISIDTYFYKDIVSIQLIEEEKVIINKQKKSDKNSILIRRLFINNCVSCIVESLTDVKKFIESLKDKIRNYKKN